MTGTGGAPAEASLASAFALGAVTARFHLVTLSEAKGA
jgi:hypothetical protein